MFALQGMSAVRENITKENDEHLRRLLELNHLNLVSIWKMENLDSHSPTVSTTVVPPLRGVHCSFYNNCLISRALMGSFLNLVDTRRVETCVFTGTSICKCVTHSLRRRHCS